MKTNNRLRPGFLYLLLVLVQFFDVVQARSPLKEAGADFVFINAEIYTMDAARTWQEAIAVDKGKIVYVGSNKGATAFQKVGTRLIDLGSSGKMILPGLHDSHVHLADGGVHLRECNLDQCKSGEQVLKVVKDYAEAHPDLKWVRGSGWSLPLFASGDPKKEALDAIISDRPVYLESQDYHSGWVNSKALEVSGITKKTLDPEGGRIERDAATGEPTGTLRESAMHIVEKLLPARCEKEYIDGLRGAQTLANSFGITSIQDAWASIDLLKAYHGLDKKGELTVKVTAAWKIDPEKEDRVQVEKIKELRQAYLSPRLRLTSAKIFADGVIEAQTAALLAPYLGSSKVECGALNLKPERFDRLVKELEREGFQVHVHAIGDKGIRTSLD
ncbi:MAG: amidohydrolase, partial [Candidatus Obscuribacterales bacterium]|nr:amidohydrolase [Candidatus Obscuribacterales bacterium]